MHTFSGPVEHAIAHIEEAAVHDHARGAAALVRDQDLRARRQGAGTAAASPTRRCDHIEEDIKAAEKELDDDAESIITNERYIYIAELIKGCYKKKERRTSCPPPIRSIRSSPTAGWACPSSRSSCSLFTTSPWSTVGAARDRLGKRRPVRRRLAPVRHRLRRL